MSNPDHTHQVTRLLADWSNGDESALDSVITLLYEDLCRIAHNHLTAERAGHTIDTKALVHESYLRLVGHAGGGWSNRSQFFAVVSRAMRRILVDHARRHRAQKRGGDRERVTLGDGIGATETDLDDLITLDVALDALEARSPRLSRVVECRFFGGLTAAETAAALGMSQRSVERDWTRARTYLFQAIEPGTPSRPTAAP